MSVESVESMKNDTSAPVGVAMDNMLSSIGPAKFTEVLVADVLPNTVIYDPVILPDNELEDFLVERLTTSPSEFRTTAEKKGWNLNTSASAAAHRAIQCMTKYIGYVLMELKVMHSTGQGLAASQFEAELATVIIMSPPLPPRRPVRTSTGGKAPRKQLAIKDADSPTKWANGLSSDFQEFVKSTVECYRAAHKRCKAESAAKREREEDEEVSVVDQPDSKRPKMEL